MDKLQRYSLRQIKERFGADIVNYDTSSRAGDAIVNAVAINKRGRKAKFDLDEHIEEFVTDDNAYKTAVDGRK